MWTLLVVLVVIQFIRPARNISERPDPKDITVRHEVPANVQAILKKSCKNCHSNHSEYPLYSNVQPVGWWLQLHINDGKRHLNFSEFASYPEKKAKRKLEEISETIEHDEMPLSSYVWMHKEAALTPEEARLVTDWAKSIQ